MDKEFTEKMKNVLLETKKEIVSHLMSNNSDVKNIIDAMETKDSIDIASDAIDGNMLEALGTKNANRIKLIDSALMRIDQGKYGICVRCGKPISQERLEAIPYALMCINCKSADERKNR